MDPLSQTSLYVDGPPAPVHLSWLRFGPLAPGRPPAHRAVPTPPLWDSTCRPPPSLAAAPLAPAPRPEWPQWCLPAALSSSVPSHSLRQLVPRSSSAVSSSR